MNRRRWHPLWLLPLALIAFVVASDLLGWSYLRRPVQSVLSGLLEREVVVGPPFRLHLRPRIPVEVGSLTIAAPEGSGAPHFVSIHGLSASVGWGVLIGRTPRIDRLEIGRATLALDDAATGLRMEAVANADASSFTAQGKGSWNDTPLAFDLKTPGVLDVLAGGRVDRVELTAQLGKTEATFRGSLADLPAIGDVSGDITVSGPSLAELALVPDLVLPKTPSYELEGRVERTGRTVKVDVSKAEIGASSMTAQLEYDAAPTPPVLRGAINASRFVLQDLGPALGTGESAAASSGVLPDREFEVPQLRAMDADVRIDLRRMDLGTDALRPLSAVRGRLLLEGGRLQLQDLNANLAKGSVAGTTTLDASRENADPRFEARLRWNGVDLRSWVQVGGDFLVAGRFSGRTDLAGTGQSTASILGSLDGAVKGRIDGGALSHQLIELAGLDVGQALGVFVSGDEPLPLTCGLIDLSARDGTVRSNLFLLDTSDTLFFLQGQVDLDEERLDLRLVQSPKDWSPLSLRAPLLLRGTFADPDIGVEAAPIALKVLASVVAGAVAPIAALVPLFEAKDNEQEREGCAPAIEQVRKKAAELREKGRGEPGERGGRAQPADEGMPQASPGGKDPGLDPGSRPATN